MFFPKSLLNRDEYFQELLAYLTDPSSLIFLDTNILSELYKINNSGRENFFNWVDSPSIKSKLKLPKWVFYEYCKSFTSLSKYNNTTSEMKNVSNGFKRLSKYLNMDNDESTLRQSQISSLHELTEVISTISDNLNKLNSVASNKKEDYLINIHNSIQNHLEPCIIESNLDEIWDYAIRYGDFRFENKIPPGYGDKDKSSNRLGDLIIWKEILSYCKEKNVKRVLFVSNDEKSDWVYLPPKVIHQGNKNASKNSEMYLIDPRLKDEFFRATGSEKIEKVNFEHLVQVILNEGSVQISELARSIQVQVNFSSDLDDSGLEFDVSTSEARFTGSRLWFSSIALEDDTFEPESNTYMWHILNDLKSYSWKFQNRAIDRINKYDFNLLSEDQSTLDKLFILGRNIYQAACGSSFEAIAFIENFDKFIRGNRELVYNSVYSGMLFEVYFNRRGTFRV